MISGYGPLSNDDAARLFPTRWTRPSHGEVASRSPSPIRGQSCPPTPLGRGVLADGVVKNEAVVSRSNGQIFLDDNFETRYAPTVAFRPGIGHRAPEDGRWLITGRCSTNPEHEVVLIRRSCDKISCPDHYKNYIREKAEDIAARDELYTSAKLQENAVLIPGERRQILPRHIPFTVSPAHLAALVSGSRCMKDGRFNESLFLDLFRTEFNRALKVSGLVGGCSVYHDGRLRHPGTGATGTMAKVLLGREAKLAGDMKDDSPAWHLYDHIRKQKNWRDYWRFSPHFHVTGYGELIPIGEFEKRMPGWTYHNKGPVQTVFGLSLYLLSHAAVIAGRHSLSWFGRLHQKALSKEQEGVDYIPVLCPTCGAPLIVAACASLGVIGREMTREKIRYLGFFQACGPPGGDKCKNLAKAY